MQGIPFSEVLVGYLGLLQLSPYLGFTLYLILDSGDSFLSRGTGVKYCNARRFVVFLVSGWRA